MENNQNDILLQVEHLKKYFVADKDFFGKPTSFLKAVDDVSLTIPRASTLGIVGESGCGKTTLGRTILHLHDITDGKIIYDGEDITHYSRKQLMPLRRKMQIVFQDPYSSLNPRFTIGQIIEEGLITHKFYRQGSQKMRDHVVNTMKECGLQE